MTPLNPIATTFGTNRNLRRHTYIKTRGTLILGSRSPEDDLPTKLDFLGGSSFQLPDQLNIHRLLVGKKLTIDR